MSFEARELNVRLFAPDGTEFHLMPVCNLCDTTGGVPKPACPQASKPPACQAPSKPQCQAPSVKTPKKRAAELEALDLALLRSSLRETLLRT